MTEKRKSAVSWLEEKLKSTPKPILNSDIDRLFEQSKALEREQIEKAYEKGEEDTNCDCYGGKYNPFLGSDYFTKTYGDEK